MRLFVYRRIFIFGFSRTMPASPFNIKAILCVVFAVAAVLIAWAVNVPVGDFGNYYYASLFFTQDNGGSWVYDPSAFNLAVYETGEKGLFLNYTPVPPFSLLLYVPFTLMPVHAAKLCWNLISLGFLFFTLYRFHTFFKIKPDYVLLIFLLLIIPLRSNFYQAQSYLLILFLLTEGLIAYLQGKKWLCAVCWSLCIHLKIFPAMVLLFLAAEKQWKLIGYVMLCLIAGMLLCIPFTGIGIWSTYLTEILPRLGRGEINHTYANAYQSMLVLLKKLFVPDAMHNPHTWINAPALYQLFSGIFNILILITAWMCHRQTKNVFAAFAIWITAALLISGYGSSYSLLLLMIPAMYACSAWRGARLWIACALLLLVAVIPYADQLPVVWQFPRLYLLCLFFIFLLIGIKGWRFSLRYLWLVSLAALTLLSPYQAGDKYFLKQEEALLLYDYKVDTDHLVLFFYDQHGPQQKKTGLPFMATSVEAYPLDSITSGTPGTRIKKACVVNGHTVLYLSDQNRGVGFYTLRTFHTNR